MTRRSERAPTRAVEMPLFLTGSVPSPTSQPAPDAPRPRQALPTGRESRPSRGWAAAGETALVLVALDALAAVHWLWPAQLLSLAILLTLPGFLVLRATGLSTREMAGSPGWLPVASLVALTVIGLVTDLVAPLLGVPEPLRVVPLLLAVNVTLLALALLPGPATPFGAVRAAVAGVDLRSATVLGVPLLAVLGALRLNSGGGPTVAIAAVAAAVALLITGVLLARSWSPQRLGWVLYAVTGALLLGFSVRSWYVFGWDISAEYGLVHSTLADGVWHTGHPGDAYGAMLSLTVLPAVLHAVTGLSGLVLLKLVYPALFALFPVVTFVLLRRVLSTRAAFLAASLLLAQGSFLREMPALARQELGLLAYVTLLAVMLDRAMRRLPQVTLLVLLAFAVTVFHYSTNYTLISLLLLAVAVEFVVSFWHRTPRFDSRKVITLGLAMVMGLLWYGGITQSTSNAVGTASSLLQSGLQILPNAGADANPIQAFLKGNLAKPLTVPEYQAEVARVYSEQRPWVVKAPDAADPRWQLAADPTPPSAPSSALLGRLVDLFMLLVSQLVNLLAVLGALVLLLRRRVSRGLLDFAVLAVPAVMLLGVVRLSGTLAGFYGQDRLLIQLLPIVSVPAFWLLSGFGQRSSALAGRVADRAGRTFDRFVLPAAVAVLGTAILFQVSVASGLLSATLGQHTSSNLYNAGENFERFYVTTPEVSAAQWLAQEQPEGTITYTDLYGQLRIYGYGKVKGALLTDITPETVDVNSWVYATRANVVGGRARAYLGSGSVVYAFPRSFLENQLGIVYSNGTAEIYHR